MNRTVITRAHIRGATAIAGLAVGVSLIVAGLTLALRGHADHAHTPDLFMDPPIPEQPRGQMPSRLAISGGFFVFGAGVTVDALLLDLDRPLTVAYAAGVVTLAAIVGAVLYRLARRGGAR